MKVAHILNVPLWSHGGVALLAREIAFGLADEFPTLLICPKSDLTGKPDATCLKDITQLEWEPGFDHIQIAAFIVRCLETHDVRVVIFHGGDFSWGLLSRRRSTINKVPRENRFIMTVNHQSNPLLARMPMREKRSIRECLGAAGSFIFAWYYKNLQLRHLDLEINVSGFERKRSIQRYPWFRKKFKVIYHSRLDSKDVSTDFSKEKRQVILCVGHYAYRKGQHVLIKAFSRIADKYPTWRLQLVGGTNAGEYHERIESLLDTLNLRDRVDLVTETFDPDEYFKNASIYVQPSIVEAYGLALQEAMHFGCACSGSRAGGILDSITDPAYLFAPGDDQRLANILERLVADDGLLKQKMKTDWLTGHSQKRYRQSMLDEYRKIYTNAQSKPGMA